MSIIEKRHKYPKNIHRVTAGAGGDSTLIVGSEKTCLIDTGMAYCHENLIENIESVFAKLGENTGVELTLDYVFLSHSHYDHIGAVPYIKKRWPQVKICGSEYCGYVLTRPNAAKVIEELSEAARLSYGSKDSKPVEFKTQNVDVLLKDMDKISLGNEEIIAYETKGHTDCSMAYLLMPENLLFASESTGLYVGNNKVITAPLKSCKDTILSVEKIKSINPKVIVSPHYGILPKEHQDNYGELYKNKIQEEKQFFVKLLENGATIEEIHKAFEENNWCEEVAEEQPIEAFRANATSIINTYIREIRDNMI